MNVPAGRWRRTAQAVERRLLWLWARRSKKIEKAIQMEPCPQVIEARFSRRPVRILQDRSR